MTNDPVTQALAELHDLVRCRCHPAYTGRGLHDPDCECDSAEAVKMVADRIEELEARHANDCEEIAKWREIVSGRTISENFEVVWRERLKRSEAKLAKAVEALERLVALNDDYSPFGGELLQDRVERTWQKARTTLAELTGGKDE